MQLVTISIRSLDELSHMIERLRQRSVTDPGEQSSTVGEQTDSRAITQTTLFRLGRWIYGGILLLTAVDGLRNTEQRARYAEAKNVPRPTYANIISHALLLIGSVGIILWRGPVLATSAVVTFLLGVTPPMHNFWTVDDPERKQQELFHFLKNTALLGTALLLLGIARREETLEKRSG